MAYKHAVVNLSGIMPDGVLPKPNLGKFDEDKVHIYYRSNGNLYLFDSTLNTEFNLFNLENEVT